jgi:hypothetical protein
MRKFMPTLAFASTLAFATLCEAASDCPALLGPMAGIMQSARMGARLSPVEQQTWRQWNTLCKDPAWQEQLAQTLPGGPPAPMVIDTPIYTPPLDPVPSITWRDYVRAGLEGFAQGLNAPITTCRTTYAQRKGRAAYYTTCNTFGGY